MSQAILEHVNYTTKNPQKTAAWMQKVFGWTIRWEGPALNDGYTIHIGGDAFTSRFMLQLRHRLPPLIRIVSKMV